ncbi:PREDICTED: protein indeterminate-domain 7-like isoform X2 [Nicotiana attenuata]|uniref:protein indeterminate-domain 7-like isoform X2 n=1 Tax=Nicotiana attenuata TaxID=49451 RepID=UPI000904EE28|nr:PREDICTED: protein indeterminate-domain 7-like isoform X2 [Nicotiana attenuata]
MMNIQQKQQNFHVEENMSNLTSASGEASLSSSNNMNDTTTGGIFIPQNQNPPQQQIKKKRNQAGNPDPEAEVIALSPKTLLATNRFFCEICNKGFKRDQNLQLHRRGHNLPWKLKQRTNKEVIKKVYVCPEPSCVHHDSSRALGDLTGIKKHFSRKHGEKKWKCEKCSKRYAVQSDCKAHSKTCGTREYRCECGTLFSRRDSFITHRAFCDTLAAESARSAITGVNPIISFSSQAAGSTSTSHMNQLQFQTPQYFNNSHEFPAAAAFSMKKEQSNYDFNHLRHNTEIPQWLVSCQPFVGAGPGPPSSVPADFSSSVFQATRFDHEYTQSHQDLTSTDFHENPNPNFGGRVTSLAPPYHSTGEAAVSPHISATALLQKAAELGATMSNKANAVSASSPAHSTGPAAILMRQLPHQTHVSVTTDSAAAAGNSYGNKVAAATVPSFSFTNATGFEGSTFEDAFGGFGSLNSKKDNDFNGATFSETTSGINEDIMTKDFLGLRPLSHSDIFNIAGLVNTTSSENEDQFQNHNKTWQS